mmetsp:Transcript_41695/g.99977  ORF Transcript_41695/g.99977 Transcript_41695/m.99977 type:complete len:430 (-) Transcript_41695:459-1748(-)
MVRFTDDSPEQEREFCTRYTTVLLQLVQSGRSSARRVASSFEAKCVARQDQGVTKIINMHTQALSVIDICRRCCLTSTTLTTALYYLEQLLRTGKLEFHASTWRTLWVNAIMLAEKFWEDNFVCASHIVETLGTHTGTACVEIQFEMLQNLKWNMNIDHREHAKFYNRIMCTPALEDVYYAVAAMVPRGDFALVDRPRPGWKPLRQVTREEAALLGPALVRAAALEQQAEDEFDRAAEEEARAKAAAKRRPPPRLTNVVFARSVSTAVRPAGFDPVGGQSLLSRCMEARIGARLQQQPQTHRAHVPTTVRSTARRGSECLSRTYSHKEMATARSAWEDAIRRRLPADGRVAETALNESVLHNSRWQLVSSNTKDRELSDGGSTAAGSGVGTPETGSDLERVSVQQYESASHRRVHYRPSQACVTYIVQR